jgi:transposase-like protein
VSTRVSPAERVRAEIDALFAAERPLGEIMEEVARLGVRLVMQTALEAEVTEFLGRERYGRGARERPGSRNGHCPTTIKTTAGPVRLERPKLRGTEEAFASRLLGIGVTRSHALESLVIAGFVRGLSVRDTEATLADALGPEAALSKSTVSRICQAICAEFEAWRERDLSELELDYLFLDASHFRMHPGARAEPILAAWGIDTEGKPTFIGLAPAGAESDDAWDGFLAELTARGLRSPLLVISDGARGLVNAAERAFPAALRQRCAIHRARNLLAKVSAGAQEEVKAAFWSILDEIDAEPGEAAIAVANARAAEFTLRYGRLFPEAVRCLEDDFASLTAHLRFPAEHRRRVRHSNFIERTFGETRRRVKVIGRLPGERSCLSLVWAVLDRASRGWRGVTQTPAGLRLLQDLRRELLDPPTAGEGQEAIPTAA